MKPAQIAKHLDSENRPKSNGSKWGGETVRRILQREGLLSVKALDRSDFTRDPQKALERIKAMRSKGLSLREIGRALSEEKIAPPRGSRWYAGTVSDILSKNTVTDQVKAIRLAAKLRESGMSLRKIGEQLMLNSISPPKGGYWHAEQVSKLLRDGEMAAMADSLSRVLSHSTAAPSVGPSGEPPTGAPEEPAEPTEGPSAPPPTSPRRRRNRQAA